MNAKALLILGAVGAGAWWLFGMESPESKDAAERRAYSDAMARSAERVRQQQAAAARARAREGQVA